MMARPTAAGDPGLPPTVTGHGDPVTVSDSPALAAADSESKSLAVAVPCRARHPEDTGPGVALQRPVGRARVRPPGPDMLLSA